MREAGKRGILLGVTPEQHELIRAAAEREMRPMTQFVTYYALQAAAYVLEATDLEGNKP